MPRNPSTRSIQQLAVMESYYMDYVNAQLYQQSYPDTLMSYMEFVHLANYHFDRYVRPVMGKVLTEPSVPTRAPYTYTAPTPTPQSQ